MNLEKLTKEVAELCKEIAIYISSERINFNSSLIEVKSKNSLVSHVDKTSEKMLVKGLKTILPEAAFLTEEETIQQEDRELKWVIDPLDGTTNFMHGIPVYSISITLMNNNEPVIGVVHEINQNESFTSWKQGGAYLNETPISVAKNTSLQDSLIATGFPYYDYEKINGYLGILGDLMQSTRGIRRLGSAAVDLAYVACGRFDSFFEYSLNAWDVAAGCLLVSEAGGKLNDFKNGNDYIFGREIIASSNLVHEEVKAKVDNYFQQNQGINV